MTNRLDIVNICMHKYKGKSSLGLRNCTCILIFFFYFSNNIKQHKTITINILLNKRVDLKL